MPFIGDCAHCSAQLPADNIAVVVIEDRRLILPAPANDLEVGKISLLQLVRRHCLVLELAGSLHHNEVRAGDQVASLEKPVTTGSDKK